MSYLKPPPKVVTVHNVPLTADQFASYKLCKSRAATVRLLNKYAPKPVNITKRTTPATIAKANAPFQPNMKQEIIIAMRKRASRCYSSSH